MKAKVLAATRHRRACPGDLDQKGTMCRLNGMSPDKTTSPAMTKEEPPGLLPRYALPEAIGCPGGGIPAALGGQMLDAVLKALGQMFSPPFRMVLVKSVGLAIAFLAVMAVVLFRLLEWLSGAGT